MTYVYWKVVHTPFLNNGWNPGDETVITNLVRPQTITQLGDTKDSFQFNLVNTFNNFDNFFNVNDKIVIYRTINTNIVTDSDIIMVGTISDNPDEYSYNSNKITCKGVNFSETIANAIVFADLNGKTVPNAIKFALENAAQKNPNFKVTWDSGNDSYIATKTFPTLVSDTRFFNKPLKNILEKYSSNQKTNNGDFYWYVSNSNTLVWRPKISSVDYSFNSSTSTHLSMKTSKDKSGIKNFFILKGGKDPQGNQIQTRYVNWSSVNKNGIKYYIMVSENNNARNLIQGDLRRVYGDNIGNNSYPSFPFTSTWVSKDTGSVITATSASDYVEKVRNHIKAALVGEARLIAEYLQYGKFTLELTFKAGTKTWGLGTNVECTIPEIRSIPFILRVKKVQLTSNVDTYTLEEDVGTIGAT